MDADKTLNAAQAFLNANDPKRRKLIDDTLSTSRKKLNLLRDFYEEDCALPWPDAPTGMYWSKAGWPMQKGFHSKKG